MEADLFSVALIPHTLQVTTLGLRTTRRPGQPGNGCAGQVRRKAVQWSSKIRKRESETSGSRQTKSFLIHRFREMGISPATRHGQNFLIDLNLQQMIVDAAQLDRRDVVLEVGTGTGSLTAQFASQAAAVVTVEIDGHLFELASELLLELDNVTMLQAGRPAQQEPLCPRTARSGSRQRMAEGPDRRLKLVANLPYNIATPVLSNLLVCDAAPQLMVATIQKELADRMVAEPRSKEYGALSVWMQARPTPRSSGSCRPRFSGRRPKCIRPSSAW